MIISAGGTVLRYKDQTKCFSHFTSYPQSRPAVPADKMSLLALVDLRVHPKRIEANLNMNFNIIDLTSNFLSPDTRAVWTPGLLPSSSGPGSPSGFSP